MIPVQVIADLHVVAAEAASAGRIGPVEDGRPVEDVAEIRAIARDGHPLNRIHLDQPDHRSSTPAVEMVIPGTC